jgi:hypothetical protein
MAMGIVSDSDLESELNSLNRPRLVPVEHIQSPDRGRGQGNNAVPESLRRIISDQSINGTPAKELSEAFGISPSSISAYKNDATSTASYNKPNKDLRAANNIIRERIVGKARKKLIMALDQITPDKLVEAKLRDLVQLSAGMATVLDKVEPHDDGMIRADKLLIYMPRMRDEQSFDVIDVKE